MQKKSYIFIRILLVKSFQRNFVTLNFNKLLMFTFWYFKNVHYQKHNYIKEDKDKYFIIRIEDERKQFSLSNLKRHFSFFHIFKDY